MSTEWQRLCSRRVVLHAGVVVVVLVFASACATRVSPPTPTTPAHPEFLYPQIPPALATALGIDPPDAGIAD